MGTMSAAMWIVFAVLVSILPAATWIIVQRSRSEKLRAQFDPEYAYERPS